MLGRWAGRLVTGPLAFLASGLIDLVILAVYLHRHRKGRADPPGSPHFVTTSGSGAGAFSSSSRR